MGTQNLLMELLSINQEVLGSDSIDMLCPRVRLLIALINSQEVVAMSWHVQNIIIIHNVLYMYMYYFS